MRIRNLTLQNFRGFEDATLDLDRPLTVLFGVNGSGKSSVLDACAIVLSEVRRDAVSSGPKPWDYDTEDTDIRRSAAQLTVRAMVSNGDVSMDVAVVHPSHPASVRHTRALRLLGGGPALAVRYDARRSVARAVDAFASTNATVDGPDVVPSSPIHDALSVGELGFRSFFQWFRSREDVENERKVAEKNFALEDRELGAVRRAVTAVLPGFAGLRIQRDPLHMVVQKDGATLAVDQLSDGETLTLALTADLARRLAMTHPSLPDPLQGEAVVLIDEIELHLHPSWQRRVLHALRETFPNCQFIVTTHSPQVLSEVPNDAVVLVKDFAFLRPGAPTAGRDSNAILAEAMDTAERPEAQLEAIRAISALLDEGKHDEARAKLNALSLEVSERDREIVSLRTMLHFLEAGDEAHSQGH